MIVQTVVDPISFFGEALEAPRYKRINGRICQVEMVDSKETISRLISTCPADYLDPRYAPGKSIR